MPKFFNRRRDGRGKYGKSSVGCMPGIRFSVSMPTSYMDAYEARAAEMVREREEKVLHHWYRVIDEGGIADKEAVARILKHVEDRLIALNTNEAGVASDA